MAKHKIITDIEYPWSYCIFRLWIMDVYTMYHADTSLIFSFRIFLKYLDTN